MSNTIRANAAIPQQPVPSQGFLGRMVGGVKRAINEAFNPPATPKASGGPDSYVTGQPLSVAAQRRLSLQNSGMRTNRSVAGASEDAQLVAYLNHIANTGDPIPPDASQTRVA